MRSRRRPTNSPFLDVSRSRQPRRRTRRPNWKGFVALLLLLVVAGGIIWLALAGGDRDGARVPVSMASTPPPLPPLSPAPPPDGPAPGAVSLDAEDAFRADLKRLPRAGLVFDVGSGRVLWRLNERSPLPVASLTKLMTALLVAERTDPSDRVRITPTALFFEGQAVGNLPVGKKVPIEALLHGALLTSGNDAALALAEHTGGSVASFVRLMNRRAEELGLTCTHFVSPHGLEPGNRSCPADLAALSRLVLAKPRLARVVRKPQAVQRFPIPGGKLYTTSTNPLLLSGYRGTIGLKTGYNQEAGRCFIAVVRRGGRTLATVLLHSPDPSGQARRLFAQAFRTPG